VRHVLALFALFVASGCAGAFDTSSPGAPAGPPVVAAPAAEDQTCRRDTDCVLVQDCCGCARQGRQLAVHRDRLAPLTEAATAGCEGVSCTVAASTHRSCTATQAACRGGRCIPAIE
jgi:hypothetical protein